MYAGNVTFCLRKFNYKNKSSQVMCVRGIQQTDKLPETPALSIQCYDWLMLTGAARSANHSTDFYRKSRVSKLGLIDIKERVIFIACRKIPEETIVLMFCYFSLLIISKSIKA